MDKCTTTYDVTENGTPHTTQIVYNYEFIDDFDEAQLSVMGSLMLKKVLHYKSQSQDGDIKLTMINHQAENGDTNLFSTSSPESVEQHNEHTKFSVEKWGPKVFDKDNHTMSLMVAI